MIKRSVWSVAAVVAVAGLSAAAFGAEPKEDVQAAVKKLADGGNYSWVVTTDSPFTMGATGGKTDKDGTTTYTVAQFQGTNDVVVQGGKLVVKMDDGTWKTGAEIAKSAADATAAAAAAATQAGTQPGAGDGGGGFGGGTFVPETFLNNMLLGLRLPTADLKDVVDKVKELKKKDMEYTADLTADVAKDLLMNRRPGAPAAMAPAGGFAFPDPTDPKGSVKITLKEGQVVKYEVHLSGNFSFGGQDTPVDRTNTTEFKDVGTTKVVVPTEAKAKLTGVAAAASEPVRR